MLYWAEGSRQRNQARFTNSDPEMVRLFVSFLRTYFDLEDSEIRITCNLFADHLERQHEIEQFWLDVAGLPASCLCTSTVNTYSKYSKKKRQNKLPYATCRITVSRTRHRASTAPSRSTQVSSAWPGWNSKEWPKKTTRNDSHEN
jgi:hypothetical protein